MASKGMTKSSVKSSGKSPVKTALKGSVGKNLPKKVSLMKAGASMKKAGLKLNPAPLKGKLTVSKEMEIAVRPAKTAAAKTSDAKFTLPSKQLLKIYDRMMQARCLEQRLILMYKQSDGYFWIGGPGEEAFNIPLGMQVKAGHGLDYDFLNLHYRSSGILLSMGAKPLDMIRQMKNVAADPYSGGRNFGNHTSIRALNVLPITSTIETQYQTAIGTGIAHQQHGGTGITIVNGGDAGTAEGEFASCLIWASRPKNELPILMIVTNNEFGISTPANTQHGEKNIADRATAFGIKNRVINGNDVEESWLAIEEAMAYVRKERKPFLLEARVSRLYGHSSATGANYVTNEEDSLVQFEKKLIAQGVISKADCDAIREKYTAEFLEMGKQVKTEAMPDGSTIYDHTFKGQKGKYL